MIERLYNIKWFFKNVWRYRKGLYYHIRPWDSHGAMWMFKEIIRDIRDTMQDASGAQEVDETRIPKEQDIARLIELIENQMADNYAERCGYDYGYKLEFIPEDEAYEMLSTETKEQQEQNDLALSKAQSLEKAEHEELTRLIGKYRGWWI